MSSKETAKATASLQSELHTKEAELGVTVVSLFPGANEQITAHEQLRAVIDALERVGEELRDGTLEEIELED